MNENISALVAENKSKLRMKKRNNIVGITKAVSINNSSVDFFEGKRLYIATGDLIKGKIQKSAEKFSFEDKPSRANIQIEEGDLILARMQGTTKVLLADKTTKNHIYSTGFISLKPKQEVFGKFLYHYFNSSIFQREKDKFCSGATQKAINNANFKRYLKIPLPNLETQKAIAAKLDAADALRQKDQELLEQYDQLAQSIFMEMFGDPVLNEKGWEMEKLSKLCSKIGSGATPRGGKEAYKKTGVSLIRSLNVHDNQFVYKDLAFIDERQAEKLKNVIVKTDDVLFNITGASVCRCTIVPSEILPARVNQHVSILRCKKEVLVPEYLMYLLTSDRKKQKLERISRTGGATREAITKEDLNSLMIIIPPFTLQTQFAEKIKNIEAQKALVRQQAEQSEMLFQALLQESFNTPAASSHPS